MSNEPAWTSKAPNVPDSKFSVTKAHNGVALARGVDVGIGGIGVDVGMGVGVLQGAAT
jgi:hypothetical protein